MSAAASEEQAEQPKDSRAVRRLVAASFALLTLGAAPVPAAAAAGGSGAGLPGTPLAADPVRDEQWQLKALDVNAAWKYSTGEGVTVAVVDSGVYGNHADLRGQVVQGIDMVGDTDGRVDPVGHGTTVAAIIAGRADDDAGVVGIAPKAKILPVRVLDKDNRYDDALVVAKAVRWAVDSGAKVVNLSLGGTGSSASLAAAIDYAFAKDVVVVACTGNLGSTGPSDVWYPAREPGVIAVAGLDRDGSTLWNGSITGKQTVIAAPANELVGARPGTYWRVQGTSFAAPMVSATAALIRARWPSMPAADVVNRIITTARDIGPAGVDDKFGYGMIDPVAALTVEVPTVARNPLDTTPSPGVARFGAAPGSLEHAAAGSPAGGGGPGSGTVWTAAPPARAAAPPESPGGGIWWGAAALLALSAAAAAFTAHRVSRLA